MIVNEREALALVKLLKVARMKADETGRRIAELETARLKAEAALRLLDEAVSNEEAAAKAAEIVGFAQLAGFLAGASRKRAALEATRAQVAAEIDVARRALEDAYSEVKKLEHLVERSRLAADRRDRRVEAVQMGDAAIARFIRKNGH